MREEKLIPADPERCQTDIPNGNTFMTLGGRPGYNRCENKPIIIATQNNQDGGSMSLCASCWKKALEQLGGNYFSVKPI